MRLSKHQLKISPPTLYNSGFVSGKLAFVTCSVNEVDIRMRSKDVQLMESQRVRMDGMNKWRSNDAANAMSELIYTTKREGQ